MVSSKFVRIVAIACLAASLGCAPSTGTPEVKREGCAGLPRPRLPELVAFEPAFDGVEIAEGTALAPIPGDPERWVLATKPGVAYLLAPGRAPAPWIDIRDRVEEAPEAGLLGLAFHPRFTENGEVFLSYTTPGGERFTSRVSRFVSADAGATLNPATESVVLDIEQPYGNHDGGDIHFGPDGFLYAGWGDGGAHSDPRAHGQNLDTLLGTIVRLDVDGGDPYAIPGDNPFAEGGGRPEIFAYGFRNPWRFSFDSATGELWAGDVGQNLWEEVDLVVRGGNYGWSVKEASSCFGRDECGDGFVEPVAQYRNTGGASVVAGAVYRGRALPELVGAFVYSDFYRGTVWAVRPGGVPEVIHRSGGRRIAAWAEDREGELYGVDHGGGIVRMMPPAPAGDDAFPRALSATECVDMADPATPAPGTVAYEVAVPFWSDGADKVRALAMPSGARMGIGADGDIDLPAGSVLVKSFFTGGVPLETRLLVRHGDGEWAGYGYAWREDGTEADFVPDGAVRELAGAPWTIPSVETCAFCHTGAAGGSLGLEAAQLQVPHAAGGDQLDRFIALGLLGDRPSAPALPDPTGDAPLGDRARAVLHVNCSQCHREDGPQGRASLDLRASTPLATTGLCDAPGAGEAGLADPRVLAPGDPSRSVLVARMRSLGSIRMPPVSSSVVDDASVALVESWIASLGSCP